MQLLLIMVLTFLLSRSFIFKSKQIKKMHGKNTLFSYDTKKSINDIKPITTQQIKYDEFLSNPQVKIIIGNGPAGTGKTLLACKNAIKHFQDQKIEKIIITRPMISVEEDMGFLPGGINDKMNPWTIPIFDVFKDYYTNNELKYLISENKIEIAPLGFMRGRTFKNSFIIADEMQNSSPTQMLMLLTRIGENSKMVLTGDLKQSDIKTINGFEDLINKINKVYGNDYFKMIKDQITFVTFKEKDIVRSKIVSKILDIYKN